MFYIFVLVHTKEDDTRKAILALDGCYIEELCHPVSYLGRICTLVLLYLLMFNHVSSDFVLEDFVPSNACSCSQLYVLYHL